MDVEDPCAHIAKEVEFAPIYPRICVVEAGNALIDAIKRLTTGLWLSFADVNGTVKAALPVDEPLLERTIKISKKTIPPIR